MKRAILCLSIFLISYCAKSQIWEPQLVATLQKYYIVPVEFKSFGEWTAGMENDSSLIF